MKTIRQIADEIGVSKQAVFKKIKREPLSTSLQGLTATVDGKLMVEVDGEKLIKQAFSEIAPSTTDNQLTGTVDGLVDGASTKNAEKTTGVDGVISVLQATIDTLQGQLEMKDRQIEQQAQTITRLTDALAAAQQTAAEQEIAALEKQRKALQGNVKLLKAVEKVKPDLDAIQPEKTLTGAVKGVTVEQVKELKAAVIRGAAAEQKVRELKVENQQLQQKIPSTKEKLKEAQERQRLENENRQLKVQVEYLEKDLSWERGISARLREGIGAALDFLDRHLPEQFRPLVEKARELLPVPEVQQPEREQEWGHTWGGMEL